MNLPILFVNIILTNCFQRTNKCFQNETARSTIGNENDNKTNTMMYLKTKLNLLLMLLSFTLIILLNACNLFNQQQQTTDRVGERSASGLETIELIWDTDGQTIKVQADKEYELSEPAKSNHKLYIGILKMNYTHSIPSTLSMPSMEVPLTSINMMDATVPFPISIQSHELNKLVIVSGYFDGAALYNAKIQMVFKESPQLLIYQLLEQKIISLDDVAEKKH